MRPTLLRIDAEIPASHMPSTPTVVFYDNGDWEIVFAGDVDYIRNSSDTFVGAAVLIEAFNEVLLLNDFEEIEEQGDRANLLIDMAVPVGALDEPVLGFWPDGEWCFFDLDHADRLIRAGAGDEERLHNYISLVDLVKETDNFLRYHADDLFEDEQEIDEDGELVDRD